MALAREGTCGGNRIPVLPGITPGSGPAHLSLFGYDPVNHNIGRGMLGAAGIGFPLEKGDVAVRVNFASFDAEGTGDRPPGRPHRDSGVRASLCHKLDAITVEGVEVFVKPVKQHRAAIIFRGAGLGAEPSTRHGSAKTGSRARAHEGQGPRVGKDRPGRGSLSSARLSRYSKDEHPANGILLRGFRRAYPLLPSFQESCTS